MASAKRKSTNHRRGTDGAVDSEEGIRYLTNEANRRQADGA
jgi:hypothetical protein